MYKLISDDVFSIISELTWNLKISQHDLLLDFQRLRDVHESIPHEMLSPVVYVNYREEWLPNPYIEWYPYFPLKYILPSTIFSELVLYIPHYLRHEYFFGKYRGPVVKKCSALKTTGLSLYNQMYFKFFRGLSKRDFAEEYHNIFRIIKQLKPLRK